MVRLPLGIRYGAQRKDTKEIEEKGNREGKEKCSCCLTSLDARADERSMGLDMECACTSLVGIGGLKRRTSGQTGPCSNWLMNLTAIKSNEKHDWAIERVWEQSVARAW